MDINDYKRRTDEKLDAVVAKVRSQVLKTHRKAVLSPMSSYQRRAVHFKLQNEDNITTYSIGSEPNRRVVVAYTTEKKSRAPAAGRINKFSVLYGQEMDNGYMSIIHLF